MIKKKKMTESKPGSLVLQSMRLTTMVELELTVIIGKVKNTGTHEYVLYTIIFFKVKKFLFE